MRSARVRVVIVGLVTGGLLGSGPSASMQDSSPVTLPVPPGTAVDAATNPCTQIIWGIRYIRAAYGTPQAAWAHELAYSWY